jgi:hypothetical protein
MGIAASCYGVSWIAPWLILNSGVVQPGQGSEITLAPCPQNRT